MEDQNLYCSCGRVVLRNMGGSISYQLNHSSYIYQPYSAGTYSIFHSCGQQFSLVAKTMGTVVQIDAFPTNGTMSNN